jgi:hypothetical protein
MEITKRIRVNLSTSVKGIITPDVTIEYTYVDSTDGGVPPNEATQGNRIMNNAMADETSALLEYLRAQYPLE